ncbi:ABC transporter ATP-binding protein [Falsochrobactrum shanghaiense]|uniref:ABC transporter ATP-binding protein n=1 Tax=Falsochrobactrum shanghaiense TaxID=2201899 RepID=A0A316J3P4_9HYPH|nr:ABC transporter ATP-binding protein [Falsochrobactrum shanghaiense]PWL16304.1 ABC transporter ATP-binding protein [Falsochrobactrum shanghaiense]
MLVEVRDLWKKYDGVAAVAGVDVSIAEGELRCLIGANGAGKSTFFKMLSGQITPTKGQILIDGTDVTGWNPSRISHLGVSTKTQVPNLFENLSVRENLEVAAMKTMRPADARDAAEKVLTDMSLKKLTERPAAILAHGQRQIVELGLVLITSPRIILLDEPAAGMTPEEVDQLAELLGRLRGKHTIIVVEHDMHFVGRIAEQVTVFHRGKVLAEDRMDKVMADPKVRDAYLGKARVGA